MYLPADKDTSLTGAPRHVLNLVGSLREGGDHPIVVTQREGALTDKLREHGVERRIVPLPDVLDVHDEGVFEYGPLRKLESARAVLGYNRSIARLIREECIDVVIARALKGMLLTGPAARSTGASLVWDIGVEKESKRYVWLLHCGALFLSSRVVVQADVRALQVFGSVASGLFREKIVTIYPGIDEERRRRIESAVWDNRGKERIDVITIGSVHPRKNQLMLVRAVEQAAQSIPDLNVAVVGPVRDESYFQRVKEEVRERGLEERVGFLGWREDVPELLARSEVLVTTSTREGVPYVAREAMYAGLPVVGTDVGGMPEAVEEGRTGWLVDPEDVNGLADRIVRLLQAPDLRTRMGQAGLRLVRRRFSRERFGERYRSLVAELR